MTSWEEYKKQGGLTFTDDAAGRSDELLLMRVFWGGAAIQHFVTKKFSRVSPVVREAGMDSIEDALGEKLESLAPKPKT